MKRFALLALFLLPSYLVADTVILKSGRELDGQIVNQSETTITIRTREGVQTIGKGDVRRILYGDAYRKQQDELKRQREEQKRREEEERKRREEEERRQKEEEQKRLEEEKRQAEQEAAEQAEQDRIEQERREAEEKARLAEQRKQDRLERNSYSMWIFLGPADSTLLPAALRQNLSVIQLLGSELNIRPDRSEGQSGIFGLGGSIPIWDLLFLELDGRATGTAQDFFALEGGRDSRIQSTQTSRQGFGLGEYGRIVRTTGDLHLGYRISAAELSDMVGIETGIEELERLEFEPLFGYRFRQHDATYSATSIGSVSAGPALYLAGETGDLFSRAKGPSWGLRIRYAPLEDLPLTLEMGLYGYRLSADTDYSLERNTVYNDFSFQQLTSKLTYFSSIEGGAVSLAGYYGLSENLDLFVRLRGETAEYSAERLSISNADSANPQAGNSAIGVALLSPVIAPLLNNKEEVGSIELGLRRTF